MLKLAQNELGDLKTIIEGKSVSWDCFAHLYSLLQQKRLSLANEVNSDYIGWQKQKMKVKLAAQTISGSIGFTSAGILCIHWNKI